MIIRAHTLNDIIREALDENKTEAPQANANARQEGGTHYKQLMIQPWDYIISNNLGYLEGNVVKYVTRWQTKHENGVQDLLKAKHYLDKLLETANDRNQT
jgi:hypothetical protein